MISHIALPALLVLTLVVAIYTDWTAQRIPNRLTAGTVVAAILLQTAQSGVKGGVLALLGAAIGLAGLLPFYLRRATGAGDVKLMAAVGAILGPVPAMLAVGLSLSVGGIMGLTLFFSPLSAATPVDSQASAGLLNWNELRARLSKRFPYALAIALGSLAAGILSWTNGI